MSEPLFFNAPISLTIDDKFLGYCYGNVKDKDGNELVGVSVRLPGKTKLHGNVAVPYEQVVVLTKLNAMQMIEKYGRQKNTADADTPAANPETVPDKRRTHEKV